MAVDTPPPEDGFYFLNEETAASTLDVLGDFLIAHAGKLEGVATLSENVQREAIELARQILEKLKLRFGEVNVLNGVHFTQDDDVTTMGSMEDVLTTYNQLLAFAGNMDPEILMHPAVMSATQAFGQMGYLSKEEALRLATSRRNTKMAERIAAQLSRIQHHFSGLQDTRFAALAERIQRGFTTVLGRIQNIAGPSALVGHSVEQNISSFMTSTPTAGQALRQSLSTAKTQDQTQKNIQMQQAEDAALRAQAQRLVQQAAIHQTATKDEKKESQQTATTRGRTGRQQLQQARAATGLTGQQNAPKSPDSQPLPPSVVQPSKPPAATAADIAKQIDPRILMGIQTATSTSGIKTATVGPRTAKDTIQSTLQSKPATAPPPPPITPPPITPPPLRPGSTAKGSMAAPVKSDAQKAEEQKKKKIDEQMLQPPPPPPSRGGGRGI